jgi:HSP20 family protein
LISIKIGPWRASSMGTIDRRLQETAMGTLARYNPFDDLFKDLGKGYLVRPFPFPADSELAMKIDVKESDKEFVVQAEIPGVKKEDIQLEIDGDVVSIRAEAKKEKEEKKDEKLVYSERSYGMASRSFTLPHAVDEKAAKAEYREGVLKLTLPKKNNGGGRRIAIA